MPQIRSRPSLGSGVSAWISRNTGIPEIARHDMMENDIYFARSQTGDLTTVITCMAEEAKTSEDSPEYKLCRNVLIIRF